MSCMKCLTNYAAQILQRAVEEEKEIVFTKVCVTQNIEKTSRSELIGKLPSWYGASAGEVVACVSHVDLSGVSCVCNSKLGIKITDNSKPWKTISVWGKVEGDSVDSLLYAESDDNGSYNNGLVIEIPISLASGVEDFGSIGGGGGDEYATLADLLTLGASVAYDSETHYIQLKNSEGEVLSYFDASAFIVDGMVENVEIDTDTNALVISFNTDAGKQDISIPLTSIFDPSNYLTKSEIQSDYATKASLATVATSGDYDDLLNKPSIPTVNDATLTIQKNSTTISAFTANASSDVTVNISVPTAVSDLADASSYYTKTEIDANFLNGASYDSSTHVLTLTSPDGTKVITLTLD